MEKIQPGIYKHKKDSRFYFCLNTGLKSSVFAKTELMSLKTCPGYIVKNNSVEEWHFSFREEINNEMYLFGPYMEGTFLSTVLENTENCRLDKIAELAGVLSILLKNGYEPGFIQANSILFLNNGGVFFLPPKVLEYGRTRLSNVEETHLRKAINHPDKNKQNAYVFSIAVCAYKCITGSYPFWSENEVELHDRMRKQPFLFPYHLKPTLRTEVSDIIIKGIQNKTSHNITLKDFQQLLSAETKNGIYTKVPKEEQDRIRAKAYKLKGKYERYFRRMRFFRNNKVIIGLCSLFGFIIIAFTGYIIADRVKPPVTAGKEPQQVVETYYNSITNLQYDAMQDCIANNADMHMIDYVSQRYMQFKLRMRYEREQFLFSADKWVKQGRPAINTDKVLWGIADFKILNKTEKAFLIEYEFWEPETQPSKSQNIENTQNLYRGTKFREKVYLKRKKDMWVINKIERLKTKSLQYPHG